MLLKKVQQERERGQMNMERGYSEYTERKLYRMGNRNRNREKW
jgi:hypothetical protein